MISSSLPLGRLAVQIFAGLGVSKVVNDVIVNNTNIQTSFDAVRVWTGSLVISAVVVDHTSDFIDAKMDALVAWNEKRKEEVKAKPVTT